MNKIKQERRKFYHARNIQFLSDGFQRKFVIRFCVVAILGAVISGTIIYMMSKATVTTTFEGARLTIKSTADYILPAVLLSSAVIVIFLAVSSIAILFFAYRRMKVYLCQIEDEIEKADSGDLNVHLNFRRKDDEFKILALSLNKLIHDFKKIVVAAKDDIGNLESDLDSFEQKSDEKVPKKMRHQLEQLKDELSKFNT